LFAYWNGNLIGVASDANIASGAAGFMLQSDVSVLSDAQISAWGGGSFQSTSPIITVYSQPDCRVSPFGPNNSRTVQSTKIYDVQTSSNSAVPGVDSRAAGAPVDCRISPNIPQNSRALGTFGPGVN
jgi:hypothetical protein